MIRSTPAVHAERDKKRSRHPLAFGRPEPAMHQFEVFGTSLGAKGVKGSAGSINRVAHDERDSTELASRKVGMFR